MLRASVRLASLAAALALLAVAAPAAAVPAAPPDGLIAFIGVRADGSEQVYTIKADGSDRQRVTSATTFRDYKSFPGWSADGSLIVYVSRLGYGDIYTIHPDGTGKHRLTSGPTFDTQPAFSPLGDSIAFVRESACGGIPHKKAIWVMQADGSNEHPISHPDCDLQQADSSPSWSPDGLHIVFATFSQDGFDLNVMDADGSHRRPLLQTPGVSETSPAWSPDGSRIAYASRQGGSGPASIWTIAPDGTGARRLTRGSRFVDDPSWSSDGSTLVVSCSTESETDLCIVSATDGSITRITDDAVNEVWPAWQPVP